MELWRIDRLNREKVVPAGQPIVVGTKLKIGDGKKKASELPNLGSEGTSVTPGSGNYAAGALRRWDFGIPWVVGQNFVTWEWREEDLYGNDGPNPWIELDEDNNVRILRAGFYEVDLYAAYTRKANEGTVSFTVFNPGGPSVSVGLNMQNVANNESISTNRPLWNKLFGATPQLSSLDVTPCAMFLYLEVGDVLGYQITVQDGVSLANGEIGIGFDLKPLFYAS